jgi:hypothetical protein
MASPSPDAPPTRQLRLGPRLLVLASVYRRSEVPLPPDDHQSCQSQLASRIPFGKTCVKKNTPFSLFFCCLFICVEKKLE